MQIDLSKRTVVDLSKEDGRPIKRLFVGINWNQNTFSSEDEVDLDLGIFLTKSDRKVRDARDIINYSTSSEHWSGAVEYSGDNRDGNDDQGVNYNGKHYDEAMYIYPDKLPKDISIITVFASIFMAHVRFQNFGLVSNAAVEAIDMDDPENSYYFDLSNNPNLAELTSLVLLEIKRFEDGFTIQKVARGYAGGTKELYANYGIEITSKEF